MSLEVEFSAFFSQLQYNFSLFHSLCWQGIQSNLCPLVWLPDPCNIAWISSHWCLIYPLFIWRTSPLPRLARSCRRFYHWVRWVICVLFTWIISLVLAATLSTFSHLWMMTMNVLPYQYWLIDRKRVACQPTLQTASDIFARGCRATQDRWRPSARTLTEGWKLHGMVKSL